MFIGGICAKRRYCLLIRTHDHRCRFLDVTRLLYHLFVLRLLHKILKCVCARDIHHDVYFLVRAQDIPTTKQGK